MIAFVYGGSGSGKSEYAESLVMACSDVKHRYYIATMKAYGEEGAKRVQRHLKLREGKGFQTIECQKDIASVLLQMEHPENATLLLECMSNLVANEMFDTEQGADHLPERVMEGIRKLAVRVKNLILVSANVFDDGTEYDPVSQEYMKCLGQVNLETAALARQVVEVVAGIPVIIK